MVWREYNMEKVDKGLSWVDKALTIVEKYNFRTIFKAVGVLLCIATLVGFVNNPTWVFEKYQEWQSKQHTEKLEIRLQNNKKLHILVERLLYKVNADRVLVLELHNGLSSNAGIPFAKCSATYEALNDGVYPVADQYQDTNLSLMPFATELFNNHYWYGNTDELQEIDRALSYRMLSNDTSHFAGCVIQGVDKPLAFLFVTFKSVTDGHNCDEVKKIIDDNALQIALLLELDKEYK